MSNWMEGIDPEKLEDEVAQSEAMQKKFDDASGGLDNGVHKVVVDIVYLATSDAGALSFNAVFKNENEVKQNFQEWIKSGDEKGNKPTYLDKDGKERPLPGVIRMQQFLTAIGFKTNQLNDPEEVTTKVFGEDTKVRAFKELRGKKLTIGVCEKQSLNKDSDKIYTNKYVVQFLDADGKHKGEDAVEALTKKIEKRPLIELSKKDKAKYTGDSSSDTSAKPSEDDEKKVKSW